MNKTSIHTYVLILSLYFFLAPLEDVLTSGGVWGSLARYIALFIVVCSFIELRGQVLITFTVEKTCILLLTVLAIISIFWSRSVDMTLSRIPTYLLLPGLVFYISLLPFNDFEYDCIVKAAIAGGILAVVILLSRHGFKISSYQRLTLNDNNDPNNLAALLFLPTMLCLKESKYDHKWEKYIRYIAEICLISMLLTTGSRGAVLALSVAFIAFLVVKRAYKELRYYLLLLLLALIVFEVIIPNLPPAIYNRYFNRDALMYDLTVNEGQRGRIWQIIVTRIMPSMPFCGYGAGCTSLALADYYGFLKGSHNTYLCMILEYGVFGIPVFMTMLYSLLCKEVERRHAVEVSLLIGLAVIIFFLDSYAKKFFWNIILLLLIDISVSKNLTSEARN